MSAADLNDTSEIISDDAVEEANILETGGDENNLQTVDEEAVLQSEDNDDVLEMEDSDEILAKDYQEFSDIQKQINSASSGDTIYLNGTYYGFGYPLVINKAINLVGIGEGAVLKANTNTNLKQCAIYVNSSNVIIDNLKIHNGCDQWGGAIFFELDEHYSVVDGNIYRSYLAKCKQITIKNCLFKDNSADGNHGYGGAICLWTEDSIVTNCTFTNNHCTDFGGAIYTNGMNNRITNCRFNYNYISNEISEEGLEICRGGGAIYSDCQSLIIDNCTFNDNSARESWGGALRIAASCSVQNSIFKDNVAQDAKAIYLGDKVITVFKSNIFSLQYKEDPNTLFKGVTADELKANNVFNKTRLDSTVKFSAGMVYEYGDTGSIYVTVDGGTIVKGKIKVLGHSEANVDFKNNVITVNNLPVGVYTLRVTTVPDDDHLSVDEDLKVTVKKATASITGSKITVALKKGSIWTIKLVNSKSKKPISNMKLSVKVFTGKKSKTVTVTTNSKGEASYQTKKLSKGNHKAVVSAKDGRYNFNTLSSSIKVVKQTKLKFKVSYTKRVDSSTVMFRVYKNGKAVNGIKLNLLIYDGKKVVKTIQLKSKTFKKKTGIAGYSTNELKAGKHKVVLVPVNIKYGGSVSGTLKLTSKQTSYPAISSKI